MTNTVKMSKAEFEELADSILEDVYSPMLADQDALRERIVASMAKVQATLTVRIKEHSDEFGLEATIETLCSEVMLDRIKPIYD